MVVRNEEGVLAETIESVRPIADEIIIVDTGSTDKTPAVAWKLGATLTTMPWRHDFSAARNRCLNLLTGDWALWLDAGERLQTESAAAIRTFIDRSGDAKKVGLMTVETPSLGGEIGGEQIAQPRLLPLRAGLRFLGRVRETLRPVIESKGLKIEAAPGRIIRHPRQHDQALRTLKADRNLTLAALEMAEVRRPVPRLHLTEGDAYCVLGLFDQARRAFRDVLEMAPMGSTEMLEAYYGLLTCYANDPFLSHHQLGVCVEALRIYPVDMQLLLTLGNCLYAGNHIDTAIRAFDTAVRHGRVNLEAWHLRDLDKVAEMCLNAALGLRESSEPAQPAAALEDLTGRSFRIHQHSGQQETGPLHLQTVSEALSSHTSF
jgi:glycosyltransferase involved in cell wall biosynthesis